MKLIEFIAQFPDELSCKSFFKQKREQEGITCKKCGSKAHYWLQSKEMYQCRNNTCRFRTSLKSGTVMENTKLSFQYWFLAMHLMTATKKSISSLELQRQLGHKYYEPVWAMMHKIRRVMSKRDDLYKLNKAVELDEGFFSIAHVLEVDELTGKIEKLKRGKGSQRKAKVLVMASFDRVPMQKQKKHKQKTKVKYIKMKVVEDLAASTINTEVSKSINPDAETITDDYKSYNKLSEVVRKNTVYNMAYTEVEKVLPWVHKAIANSKNLLKAIHHCIWGDYLQNYLDEFCYKFNRRYFGTNVFERTIIAAVSEHWY